MSLGSRTTISSTDNIAGCHVDRVVAVIGGVTAPDDVLIRDRCNTIVIPAKAGIQRGGGRHGDLAPSLSFGHFPRKRGKLQRPAS